MHQAGEWENDKQAHAHYHMQFKQKAYIFDIAGSFTRLVHVWGGFASVAYLGRAWQLVRRR